MPSDDTPEPTPPFDHELDAIADRIAYSLAPTAPAPRLKRRVLSAVGDLGFYFCTADRGCWEREPGLERKVLFVHPRERSETQLVRIAPGARLDVSRVLPAHAVLVVVEGALSIAAEALAQGDSHASGGAPAGDLASDRGATVLLLLPPPALVPDAAETSRTLRAESLRWREAAAGTELALVQRSRVRDLTVALMRMTPGARYEPHHHAGAEETFLLSGECVAQGRAVGAGDYHRGAEGSDHAEVTTQAGCTMVLVTHAASTPEGHA